MFPANEVKCSYPEQSLLMQKRGKSELNRKKNKYAKGVLRVGIRAWINVLWILDQLALSEGYMPPTRVSSEDHISSRGSSRIAALMRTLARSSNTIPRRKTWIIRKARRRTMRSSRAPSHFYTRCHYCPYAKLFLFLADLNPQKFLQYTTLDKLTRTNTPLFLSHHLMKSI